MSQQFWLNYGLFSVSQMGKKQKPPGENPGEIYETASGQKMQKPQVTTHGSCKKKRGKEK